MSPKKKSAKGRKMTKKKTDSSVADCAPVEEMSREQLELFVWRLHKELKQEREDRHLFKIERDKINSFWEICLHQLEDSEAHLRRKDYELVELEERNLTEFTAYKQKVKLLMCEHQNVLADVKLEDMISVKLAEDGHVQETHLLVADNKHLQSKLFEEELMFHEQVKEMKMLHRKQVSEMRSGFLLEVQDAFGRSEKQSEAVRSEASCRRCSELSELEKRKELKTSSVIASHEKSVSDMKNYYGNIISSNLNNISCLKEELAHVQRREKQTRKQLREAVAKQRELAGPLKMAAAEVDMMKREVAGHEKAKTLLMNNKVQLMKCERTLKNRKFENDILHLQIEEEERDGLRKTFMLASLDMQQKSCLRTVLLQRKVSVLAELMQQKDMQVEQLVAVVSGTSVGDAIAMERKVQEVLKAKNSVIQDLQNELSVVFKSQGDLVRTYERLLQERGVVTEVELAPLEITAKGLLKDDGPEKLLVSDK